MHQALGARPVRDIMATEPVTGNANQSVETFVLEKIDGGAPLAGTYPPGAATQEEYRRWLERRG